MMSSLADMEIFARVVATGSMSAAARDLSLSPAVVSKRLGRLEERLGTRLLQRTTRQIALTEAGQGYHERVLAILSNIEEAEAFVARRSADARGTLKISAPTTFGRMHIAPYLVPFMRANADLTVNMQLTDEMVDIVGDGYDLAIRIAELSDSTLVARRLAPVRRILVASPVISRNAARHRQLRTCRIISVWHRTTMTPGGWKVLKDQSSYVPWGHSKPIPAKWYARQY